MLRKSSLRLCAAFWLVSAACLSLAKEASAQAAPAAGQAGQCYALLVSSLPGNDFYARRFRDWTSRFHTYLTVAMKVPKDNVIVLSGDKDFTGGIVRGQATAEAVKAALGELAAKARRQDQFILFLVGHSEMSGVTPSLILPGPDLSVKDLADSLASVLAENQVVLNFTGASGGFVKELAATGRVNVAATMAGESGEPIYCEFFLRGLDSKRADGSAPLPPKPATAPAQAAADEVAASQPASAPATQPAEAAAVAKASPPAKSAKAQPAKAAKAKPGPPPAPEIEKGPTDGVVSLLEAYNWATHQTAMWIMRIKSDSGGWKTEGKESVEIFNKLYGGADDDPGARKLTENANPGKPDETIPLRTTDPTKLDAWWTGRRVVSEHAVLEDSGNEAGVCCLRGKGYEPINGVKEGEPGSSARRVVLGSAALLAAPPVEGD